MTLSYLHLHCLGVIYNICLYVSKKKKDMDLNKHERLSKITSHKLKYRNSAFIVVLHFIVTIVSPTHTLK